VRCAIIHYWLLGMRGGEKVVEALCRLYPQADIFTLFYDPDAVSPIIRSHQVTASFLNPLRKHYRSLLPLMPMALEHLDLRDYDLIISSESGPAKGIISSSRARHVCYCHSPMRYLWDLYPEYLHEWTHSVLKRALMIGCSSYLRLWDYTSASRVDKFIANSINVQKRIWRSYRRKSEVVYPPVAVETFYHRPPRDYYLIVSELVPYKRIDEAVQCFSKSGRRLKIVGDGPEYKRLIKLSADNIEFCGRVPAAELRDLYAHCRAVVQPGEEDFGIVAVEAIASGKPVVALGRGGVLESVGLAGARAGFLYSEPGEAGLEKAVLEFERHETSVSSYDLQTAALRFSEERFAEGMRRAITAEAEDANLSDAVELADLETPVAGLIPL
jgi:glycosyltransferase involved in cell wall biosynthesis